MKTLLFGKLSILLMMVSCLKPSRDKDGLGEGAPVPATSLQIHNLREFDYIIQDIFATPGKTSQIYGFPQITTVIEGYDNFIVGQKPSKRLLISTAISARDLVTKALSSPESRQNFLACAEISSDASNACSSQNLLKRLCRKLYRRPCSSELLADLDQVKTFFGKSTTRESESFGQTLQTLLISPLFWARNPSGSDSPSCKRRQRLDNFDIVSKLSFLFWSSIPDDELLNLAEQSPPFSKEQISQLVDYFLLNKDKSMRFVRDFFGQWLGIKQLNTKVLRSDVDPVLRDMIIKEVEEYIWHFVDKETAFADILTSDLTFANQTLNDKIYKYSGTFDATFSPQTHTDPRRKGLLMTAGFLATIAQGNKTQIMGAGSRILRATTCVSLHVPPGVDTSIQGDRLTMPACASCHKRIDPVGAVFEYFDEVGAKREAYDTGQKVKDRFPFGTEPFTWLDPIDFVTKLQKDPKFYSCAVNNLSSYALQRSLLPSDKKTTDAIAAEWASNASMTFRNLIKRLVTSDVFLEKSCFKPEG